MSLEQERRATVVRYLEALRTGDHAALLEVLAPDALTRWPQSGELMTGALSCLRVYQNYPGGPPSHQVRRLSGSGDLWVAELVADYGPERWYTVSIIEFDGARIARLTDYFGPTVPAPEWRREWVSLEAPAT